MFKRWLVVVGPAIPLLLLLSATGSYAGEWSVTPSISVAETYTDNVDLTSNADKQEEFITELNPGLAVRGDGRRVDLSLDYVMQNYLYGRESERNTTAHQLQLASTTELLRRHLFVDLGGSMSRQAISPQEGGFTPRLDNSNATDVTTWSISPYLATRLGHNAQAVLRYEYSDIEYDDADANGGVTRGVSLDVVDSAHPDAPSWSVSYNREIVEYDDSDEAKFESIRTELGWPVTPSVQLLGTLGYEDNVFTQLETESDPEGSFWLVGWRWLPDDVTVLQVQGGERYFGQTYYALFSTARSNFGWDVSYSEENISVLQQQLEQSVFGEDAQLLPSRFDRLELSDEVTFVRRADTTFSVDARLHALVFELYRELRESRFDGDGERVVGGVLRERWRATSLDTVVLTLRTHRLKFLEDSRVDETHELTAGVERELGRHARLSLEYEYTLRNSSEDVNDYEENALVGRFSATF